MNDNVWCVLLAYGLGALGIWAMWIASLLTAKERKYPQKEMHVGLNADQIAKLKAEFQAQYTGTHNADPARVMSQAETALLDFRRGVRRADDNILMTCSFVTGFYKRIEVEFPEIWEMDKADHEAWMDRDKVERKNHEVTSKS